MKTQIYIENGKSQIILTAETEFEQEVINKINNKNNLDKIKLFSGNFSECNGGYIRQYNIEKENGIVIYLNEESNCDTEGND